MIALYARVSTNGKGQDMTPGNCLEIWRCLSWGISCLKCVARTA